MCFHFITNLYPDCGNSIFFGNFFVLSFISHLFHWKKCLIHGLYKLLVWKTVTGESYMFVEFVRFGKPFYWGLCILIPNSALLARWTYPVFQDLNSDFPSPSQRDGKGSLNTSNFLWGGSASNKWQRLFQSLYGHRSVMRHYLGSGEINNMFDFVWLRSVRWVC